MKVKAAMKANIFQTSLLLFTMFSLSSAAAAMKGAYYPSWRASQLPPSTLNTTYFTHLYYSFLTPDNKSNYNIDVATGQSLLDFTTSLHRKTPPVTALFSIGGGSAGVSALFANMASTASTRNTFIVNTIQLARKYGFDGMDLDWESPQNTIEMGYFSSLISDFRTAIVSESKSSNKPQLLLTAAVYFSSSFFLESDTRPYPIASINKNMDWINAMCYDYHGSWDTSATGAPAALYDPKSSVSTSHGLMSWINAGILKNKLVMGIPLYGYTWTLKDPSVSGVGAPAVGIGPSGDGGAGSLLYSEIQQYIVNHNARVVLDLPTGSAYAVDGSVWIGYDSTNSTAMKVKYAQTQGIRGYFFWALSFDFNSQISKAASDSWTS